MPALALRASLAGLVLAGLSSCVGQLEARLAATEQRLAKLETQQAEDRRQQEAKAGELEEQIDFETRRIWGKIYCDSEQVRDFIKACENSDSATCTEQGLAQALAFMGSQPWVSFWMRPGSTGKDVHSVRQGQLATLTDQRHAHPSTRYLVLVQPRSDAEEHVKESTQVGREIIKLLRSDFGVSHKATSLGTRTLPCKLKAEQMKLYTRSYDQPKVGEPKANEPRIRVWVFRTDC